MGFGRRIGSLPLIARARSADPTSRGCAGEKLGTRGPDQKPKPTPMRVTHGLAYGLSSSSAYVTL